MRNWYAEVCHMIHFHTPYLPDRIVPLHDLALSLALPAPPTSIRRHPGGLALPWGTGKDGRIVVGLPPLDLHDGVEVRW